MAVNLSPVGGVAAQFFTNSGAVLTGGKLYTYLAGTTTPAATYTSSNGATAWTNPIVLNAAGRVPNSGEIWLTDGILYKFVLEDANNVLIATYDNISGINSNFIAFVNQQQIVTATAGQTVFNLSISFQPGTNSLSVFVDGVNQYGPGAQYAYVETDSDTVTFVSGLHVGAEVKFTTTQQQSAGAVDAAQVSYQPPFTGSVATNVEAKLAQYVSILDFGADPTGGIDSRAAIQAALNTGGGVFVPNGTYVVSAPLLFTNGASLVGESIFSAKIKYTGTAICCDLFTVTGCSVENLSLLTDMAGTTQAIRIHGNRNKLDHLFISAFSGSGTANGWATGWTVEPNAALTVNSFSNSITNIYCDSVRTVGARVTRAVDTFIKDCSFFTLPANTTCQGLVFDTGVSGGYVSKVSIGYGLNGIVFQNTISPGDAPRFIFFDQVLCDTTTYGDAWLFASSLSNSAVGVIATNCWAAGAGINAAGSVVTAGANGINVLGGRGIEWHGTCRANAANGAIVNSPNAKEVCFKGWYMANNQSAGADGHGVYMANCGPNARVEAARCGNLDLVGTMGASGNQVHGVKIGTNCGVNWSVVGCGLSDNTSTGLGVVSIQAGTAQGNTPTTSSIGTNGIFAQEKFTAVASSGTASPTTTLNGGILIVRNGTNGGVALFTIDATGTGSAKIGGASTIVFGAPAANQLGVSSTGTVTNNWAVAQDIFISYLAAQ